MANRFWVGGSGNWNDGVNHWSTTTGGAPGATVPGSTDDVFIDGNSGISQITMNVAGFCGVLDLTNSTITSINLATAGLSISSNFIGKSTVSFAGSSGFNITLGTAMTFTSNGMTILRLGVTNLFNGGSITFQDTTVITEAFSVGSSVTTSVDFNNQTFTAGRIILNGTNVVTLGSSVITVTGFASPVWQVTAPTTLNAGTSAITINGAGTFDGGAKTYYDVTYNANTTVTGGNTFHNMQVNPGVAMVWPVATQTITNMLTSGTTGSHISFTTTGGGGASQATMNVTHATTQYIDVKDNIAAGDIPFYDAGGVDNGNTVNWFFFARSSSGGALLMADT